MLPPGVVNTVSGGGEVGSWLGENPDVDKIMFTGSGATGARIAAAASKNLTPTTMELGGNDAAACAKRLYVPEALHDAVVAELKALADAMPMGDGRLRGQAQGWPGILPMVPFGGIKGSGWGVKFGAEGLKAATQPQVISIRK